MAVWWWPQLKSHQVLWLFCAFSLQLFLSQCTAYMGCLELVVEEENPDRNFSQIFRTRSSSQEFQRGSASSPRVLPRQGLLRCRSDRRCGLTSSCLTRPHALEKAATFSSHTWSLACLCAGKMRWRRSEAKARAAPQRCLFTAFRSSSGMLGVLAIRFANPFGKAEPLLAWKRASSNLRNHLLSWRSSNPRSGAMWWPLTLTLGALPKFRSALRCWRWLLYMRNLSTSSPNKFHAVLLCFKADCHSCSGAASVSHGTSPSCLLWWISGRGWIWIEVFVCACQIPLHRCYGHHVLACRM